LRNIRPVISSALARANVSLQAIDGIAVTCRPGLSGALLVGVELAEGLAWSSDKPLVGVDHLVGHLMAAFLCYPEHPNSTPTFPFLALLASGGHTALYRVDGFDLSQVQELGATRDDAAGEAFDKVAKLLGLGYPGGPVIDKLAREGHPEAIVLSKPMRRRDSLEFSFSGLKTNVLRWVTKHGRPGNDQTLRDVCASFQHTVVETLLSKTLRAAEQEGCRTIVLTGGVAANGELRRRAAELASQNGLTLVVPPFKACTDNGAMIAFAGSNRLARGQSDRGNVVVSPHTALAHVTRKGPGRRAAPPSAAAQNIPAR
jgi:N6-L-threonylcarbamoyladenine synthase